MYSTNMKPGALFCTRCYSSFFVTQATLVLPYDILKCNTFSQLLLHSDLCWKLHQCFREPHHLDMNLCEACFPEAFTLVETSNDPIDEFDIAVELTKNTVMLAQLL